MNGHQRGQALTVAREMASRMLATRRPLKRLVVIAFDCFSCVLAVWLSFSIRLGYWQLATKPVLMLVGFELIVCVAAFHAVGAYRNMFRFLGARGLIQLSLACAIAAIPTVVVFGFNSVLGVPRTISVLFPIIFLGLVTMGRIVARYLLVELFGESSEQKRVLIYGAGMAGRQLAASLELEPIYKFVGYIDDDDSLMGNRIENLPIHSSADLERVVGRGKVDIVLLAVPEMSRNGRAVMVKRLQECGVQVQTLPGVREIVDGVVSIKDLREIKVTELLSRDTVQPDADLLTRAIRDRTVLVTGAGGSIGSELCRQILRQRPRRLVMFEMTEAVLYAIDDELRRARDEAGLDIELIPELGSLENKAATYRLFERFRPDVVFHAAAYKHVPLVEQNAVAGVRNNVCGTLNAALAACASGVDRFVLVSTDKAVRPTNVMGASKRVCELILQALAARQSDTVFSMVRFGNVLGSSGSVVPQFERQIALGGPVTVTHREVTRFFMTIPEAAELVIQAGAMARGGEVYLLDMGEPVKIYELARLMIQLAGLSVRDELNPDGDIAIEEIGLRPGEKLYEELLISAAARPTAHSRIMMAEENCLAWDDLSASLDDLGTILDAADPKAVRSMLENLVHGFKATGGTAAAGQVHGDETDDEGVFPASAGLLREAAGKS